MVTYLQVNETRECDDIDITRRTARVSFLTIADPELAAPPTTPRYHEMFAIFVEPLVLLKAYTCV